MTQLSKRVQEEIEKIVPKTLKSATIMEAHRLQYLLEHIAKFAIEETSKAYGGCKKCYGKGYGTSIDFITGKNVLEQTLYYLPCSCNRGKQMKEIIDRLPTNTKDI